MNITTHELEIYNIPFAYTEDELPDNVIETQQVYLADQEEYGFIDYTDYLFLETMHDKARGL